ERGHVPLLEVLGAGEQHRQGAQLVDGGDEGGGGAGAGDLLDDDDGGERVGAGTAVLLGHVDGVQVVRDQRVECLLREACLLVHRGGVRRDLRLGQGADGV